MSETEIPRYTVGIDLGTTNSAMAYGDATSIAVHDAQILQLIAPGEHAQRDTLPSNLFLPPSAEGLAMPWDKTPPNHAVGLYAREQGALLPNRLIASAKSWLCHSGVNRTDPLLPWGVASDTTPKYSPVAATTAYLHHLQAAWDYSHPQYPLAEQDVIITVPASFDEVARELTVTAAEEAGLKRLSLLEEPQAAFYSWLSKHTANWSQLLPPGAIVLICDIGGGTSDFTLIKSERTNDGQIRLQRIGVGDHLLLGGDNLDLALAHHVEKKLNRQLDLRQWSVLVRNCRAVKELMLGPNPPPTTTLTIGGTGASIIGGASQVTLDREEVQNLLIEGFLPLTEPDEKPQKHRSGFQEFGLPYAPDPAISRYIAAFLAEDHGGEKLEVTTPPSRRAVPLRTRPDAILFNGGFFESPLLRDRLVNLIKSWFPNQPPPLILKNERLDLAVARGAAYYGLVRRGHGIKVASNLARAYYLGIENEKSSVPTALCIAPASMEEGSELLIKDRPLSLLVRQPVEFPLFVSRLRTNDRPGEIVELNDEEFTALAPLRTVLKVGRKSNETATRVFLRSKLTEIGTLEIWCNEIRGDRRWRLLFDARAAAKYAGTGGQVQTVTELLDEESIQQGLANIQATFVTKKAPTHELMKGLEAALGQKRIDWSPTVLRRFWEELINCPEGRGFSAEHEARWLNFLGFALRPGYGCALDDWRVERTWKIFHGKVQHHRNELCCAEWWILWRRIAAGLTAGQQNTLAAPLIAQLRPLFKNPKGAEFKVGHHEKAEIWRLLGSLEFLDSKIDIGHYLVSKLEREGFNSENGAALWSLGRIGSRQPLYAPLNYALNAELVETWLQRLMEIKGRPDTAKHLLHIVLMARVTGDRARDLSPDLRGGISTWLASQKASHHLVELVISGGKLAEEEEISTLGDSLPKGLQL